MAKKKIAEPTEALKAIAARIERIASAETLADAQTEAGRLLAVLPRPEARHVEAARGVRE